MADQEHTGEPRPDMDKRQEVKDGGTAPAANLAASGAADVPTAAEAAPANPLTPDEQMALFAKDLKENDWGHQPC